MKTKTTATGACGRFGVGGHAEAQRQRGGGACGGRLKVVRVVEGVYICVCVCDVWCVMWDGAELLSNPYHTRTQEQRGLAGTAPEVFHSYVRAHYKGAIRCVKSFFGRIYGWMHT
jgi:hypothetical protein